jgi:hypothetical protein
MKFAVVAVLALAAAPAALAVRARKRGDAGLAHAVLCNVTTALTPAAANRVARCARRSRAAR